MGQSPRTSNTLSMPLALGFCTWPTFLELLCVSVLGARVYRDKADGAHFLCGLSLSLPHPYTQEYCYVFRELVRYSFQLSK